jgi:hypothetical protein
VFIDWIGAYGFLLNLEMFDFSSDARPWNYFAIGFCKLIPASGFGRLRVIVEVSD